jgi:hypothetical protein
MANIDCGLSVADCWKFGGSAGFDPHRPYQLKSCIRSGMTYWQPWSGIGICTEIVQIVRDLCGFGVWLHWALLEVMGTSLCEFLPAVHQGRP